MVICGRQKKYLIALLIPTNQPTQLAKPTNPILEGLPLVDMMILMSGEQDLATNDTADMAITMPNNGDIVWKRMNALLEHYDVTTFFLYYSQDW